MAKGQGEHGVVNRQKAPKGTKGAKRYGLPFGGEPFGQKKTGEPKLSRLTKHEA
jgi:hypothetical protein